MANCIFYKKESDTVITCSIGGNVAICEGDIHKCPINERRKREIKEGNERGSI